MQTDRKPFYKSIFFWQVLTACLLAASLTIFLIAGLWEFLQPGQPDSSGSTQPALTPPESNPYESLDFILNENGYLTCLSGESVLGVDVSSWQKTIDWEQVRGAGMEFAMIRIGGRGTSQGALFADQYLEANYHGARNAGLQVGGYFFSQAITPEEAREEALYTLSLIEGKEMDMPIVYDWEYVDESARTADLDARTLTECTKAFCETIRQAGYEAMIYFNKGQSFKQMFLSELTDYPFWLASYTTTLDYPYKIHMWQYTNEGSVPGINGNADINLLLKYD